jgi:transcriptional regulator with XRE-family HTH domain
MDRMSEDVLQPMGSYVRWLRGRAGFSLGELSRLTMISKSELSAIEIGKIKMPGADKRRRLAAALGVRHVDLLIAAGELRDDEIPTNHADVADDDPLRELRPTTRRVEWTPERIAMLRALMAAFIAWQQAGQRDPTPTELSDTTSPGVALSR